MSIAISISNSVKGALVPGGGVPPFVNEYSMTFDGISDYLNGASTFSTLDGQSKISLSCWVKPTLNSTDEVISCGYASGVLFQLRIYSSGIVRFQFNTTSFYTTTGAGAISANVWSHILICIDKTQGSNADRGRIFINGVENQSNNLNNTALGTATTPLYIGVGYGITLPYEGLVDEVAIWSGTDLRSESSNIYNGGVPFDLGSYSTVPDHYYRMGDGDGDPTWSTNLTDNTGSYNLTSSMPADARLPISPNSYSQNSFVFDGIDDFVTMGNPADLQITGALTLSAWVKTSNNSQIQTIIGKDGVSTGTRSYLLNLATTGEARFFVFKSGSNTSVFSTTQINDGLWHHVLCVNDGADLKMYIDGTLENTTVGGGGTMLNGTSYFAIGRREANTPSNYNFLDGNIDEVYIWDNDQSGNVSTIYGNGIPTDISSLNPLSHWRFGETDTFSTTWTFVDQGSGGNDGTSSTLPESAKTGDQPYVI